ncbi:putative N-acetyltransferase YedL [Operophtera brumata]|uniref:Putative N-acetyltransferase YedL n=1 Tax=Operophtera brumata TaxID=104452 RepID=A0A0L7LDI8_OPEBR|nr:putative N-acetyltransferase YedL [Operophtera brumata]
MEAATLAKKKNTISKGKVKKSLRNVLCRPDPVFCLTLIDIDTGLHTLALLESLTLIDIDTGLHTLALLESLTLIDIDTGLHTLALLESLTLIDTGLHTLALLESLTLIDIDTGLHTLALLESLTLIDIDLHTLALLESLTLIDIDTGLHTLALPEVSDEHGKILKTALEKYKVDIPEFKKPHWKEIKSIPKDDRPKPPKMPRVNGLLFGITEVTAAVQNNQCSATIIESSINPRTIVIPLIEQCKSAEVSTLCLNGLKGLTAAYFGIPTSCLGIKCDFIEMKDKICELVKYYRPPHPMNITKDSGLSMEVDENKDSVESASIMPCPYLYRTSKRTRVFNPSLIEPKFKKAFVGQDFIEFSDKPEQKTDSKAYMSMILKKISNNQNRVKRK